MSKLLSQGGFGCVYYPGIDCKGQTINETSVVTKLQRKDFNSDNEIKIGNLVKNISFFKDFFLPVINTCPIDIRLIDKKLIDDCDIVKDSEKDYLLMNIPYISNSPFTNIFKIGAINHKHFVLQFTETYNYLLLAIKKLVEAKIVHFDLKTDNILYNSITKDPQIIDFGISIPINNLNKKNMEEYFYIYGPDYYVWPLEVHIIGYILNETKNNLTINDAKLISNEYVKNNDGLNIFSQNFRTLYQNNCEKIISQYVDKPRNYVINELLKYYDTWDNYSVSIIFLKFFEYIFPSGFYKNNLLISISQLLLLNISPNPLKRFNLDETLKQFNNLFYKEDNIDTYLDISREISIDPKTTMKLISDDLRKLKNIRQKYEKIE
tara:strand:- start:1590 stop:2723 length:1134 start_codon:yes stop_codon:yes gene_type:complete